MKKLMSKPKYYFGWCGQWYNEYHTDIRIHDYFSLMINQFPIIVVRRYDNPHDFDWMNYIIGICGFTISKYMLIKNEQKTDEREV